MLIVILLRLTVTDRNYQRAYECRRQPNPSSHHSLLAPRCRKYWGAMPETVAESRIFTDPEENQTSRSVLVMTSWISSTFGPRNISLGAWFRCASANAGLFVQAVKSSMLRHQVLTS
jgi:hypothetical protein